MPYNGSAVPEMGVKITCKQMKCSVIREEWLVNASFFLSSGPSFNNDTFVLWKCQALCLGTCQTQPCPQEAYHLEGR